MKKVAVLTDSGSDVSLTDEKLFNIHVIRMPIIIENNEYIEGVDIDSDGLYKHLKAYHIPKTAQVSQGILKNKYDELLRDYDEILHIPLSSGLSGQYQNAFQLAKLYNGKVVVADAKSACYPLAYLARDAKILLDSGKSINEVKEIIEAQNNLEAVIIPSDINYLKMGGRITKAAASLANLLKIVPILYLNNGIIDVYDKVRTEKKALLKGMEFINNVSNVEDYYWMVIHDHRFEDAKVLAAQFKELVHQEIEIREFGPVILSHTGPDTLAFGHFRKISCDNK